MHVFSYRTMRCLSTAAVEKYRGETATWRAEVRRLALV